MIEVCSQCGAEIVKGFAFIYLKSKNKDIFCNDCVDKSSTFL